eukprot:s5341_g2.t1
MLRRKHETFESPDREKYLLQMPGSIEAQAEVLEMLLEYLPRRYPNCFRVSHGSVKFGPDTVVTTSAYDWHAEYRVGDFSECPIELASRLVCEDLVVLQDGVVCAGSVMFSFSNFHKRFGMDMDQLHSKVPQYGADLQKPVNRIFNSLSPDRPLCRSNWNISWSDDIMAGYSRYPHRNPGISAQERAASLTRLRKAVLAHGLADSAWLKVEYQTLRRLRHNSSCILFTIRTFLNSFAELSSEPNAAGNLLLNLQQLHGREFSQYLGIDDPGIYTLAAVLLPCVLMLAGFHAWLSVDGRTTKEVLTSRSGNDVPSGRGRRRDAPESRGFRRRHLGALWRVEWVGTADAGQVGSRQQTVPPPWHYTEEAMMHNAAGKLHIIPADVKETGRASSTTPDTHGLCRRMVGIGATERLETIGYPDVAGMKEDLTDGFEMIGEIRRGPGWRPRSDARCTSPTTIENFAATNWEYAFVAASFPVIQEDERGKVKVRRAEDWRRSGHNATVRAHDVPTHHFVNDYVDMIRRLVALVGVPAEVRTRVFGHDMLNAYRQWPVRHPSHSGTFVAGAAGVTLSFHLAMCFGTAASVWHFNRTADALQAIQRILLWIIAGHFVDDFNGIDMDEVADSAFQGMADFSWSWHSCDIHHGHPTADVAPVYTSRPFIATSVCQTARRALTFHCWKARKSRACRNGTRFTDSHEVIC